MYTLTGLLGSGSLAIGVDLAIYGDGKIPISVAIMTLAGAAVLGAILGAIPDALTKR